MKLTEKQIEEARNAAYAKAGYNAFFGNGFDAGVAFAKSNEEELIKDLNRVIDLLLEENNISPKHRLQKAIDICEKHI